MKKRIMLRLALLVLLAAAGFFLLVWWVSPSNIVSMEQYSRLRGGMTEQEILEVLGGPSTVDRNCKNARWKVVKEWRMEKDAGLRIGFDDNGNAIMFETFRRNESILDKIRRWMRL